MKVRLECYVPNCDDGRKVYDGKNIDLGKNFIYTIREYDTESLVISNIRKYAGSWLNPEWCIAVFDVKSKDPTPFFVKEEHVGNLKELLEPLKKVDIPLFVPL